MDSVTVWAAFVAGVASFVSPCVLPMVPIYLANLAGPEILQGETRSRWPLFLHSLFFVLGMGLVFTVSGALVGLAGININPNSPLVQKISGGLLLFFGLFMLASGFIPWLNFEKRLSPAVGARSSYARSFIIGAAFTVAWTPCISPTLGSVLTIAATSETAGRGAVLLAIYSLGMGLPFLLIGAFFSTLAPLLKRLGRFSRWIYFAGGALLVVIGILIVLGKLSFLYIK
jgi:cytochrome c-type biogenesis protein